MALPALRRGAEARRRYVGFRTLKDVSCCLKLAVIYDVQEHSPLVSMTQHAGRRLLFVDDEDSIRLTLPLVLQQRGFEVKVAGSVAEAISIIQTQKFDVLLSDLNIGEAGDGFAVVRAARKVNQRCVTIILTGYPGFETAVEAIRQQIDDYVVKPADIDLLVDTVERRLAARQTRH
jgi:DNA-binding NtrC family response regulator